MQEKSRNAQIEQLWYTWAPRGMEDIRGFQVYAATSGLMDVNGATFRAINPYLGYDLPTGTNPSAATRENSPVCLAFINAGNQYLLLRKNFTGSDSAGRIGTYFIHLLTSLPANFTARDAISLWHSSFWQTSIPELTADFKDPHRYELFPAPTGILNPEPDAELKFLKDEALEKHLPFVIQAFLSLNQNQRLFIAADDHQVASLIWGLTHCLPSLLQQSLTFSTYEADVLKTDMRIVGTCLPVPEVRRESLNMARVLPADSYDGQYIMLNYYTDQHSTLPTQYPLLSAYSQFATSCLLGETEARRELQNLLTSAERLRVSSVQQLLFVYKFIDADNQSKILSLEDISAVLENFNLAFEFLSRDNVQESLIALAIQNPQWWNERGMAALTHLWEQRNPPFGVSLAPILTILGRKVAQTVADAILHKNQQTFDISWEILMIATPASKDPEPWVALFSLLSPYHPEEIGSWQLRKRLIKGWQYAAASIASEKIRPWLTVSWDKLQELFELKLPQEWLIIVVTQLLAGPPQLIPREAVQLLEQRSYQQLFMYVLRQMCESQRTQEQQAAVDFMKTLLKYGYSEKLVLFDLLLSSRNVHAQMVEELLYQAHLNQQEQLIIFEKYAETLLYWHPTPTSLLPIVESMVKLYVDQFTVKTFLNTDAKSLLILLQQNSSGLPVELKARVYRRYLAGQAICFGKQEPLSLKLLEKQYLNDMGEAIASLHWSSDKQYMNHLCYVMIATIWKEPSTTKEKYLELLLEGLCSLTERRLSTDLFPHLAAYLGHYEDVPPRQLLPYIKVALEYTLRFEPRSRDDYLLPLLKALQKQIRDNLDIIDEVASNRWPPKIGNLWREASTKQHLRPQSIKERISSFNPLRWRQDSSHVEAVKPDKKEADSTRSGNPDQDSQQPEANKSHKVRETSQQATDNSEAMVYTPSSTRTKPLQRRDIVGINKQELSQPITKAWITQVCDIKQTYIPFLLNLINKDLNTSSVRDKPDIADTLLEEIQELDERQMKNRSYLFSMVQQELVDDTFIQDWISRQGTGTKKGAEKSIDNYLKAIINKPPQHKSIKKQMAKDGFELKNVLLIFLRRHYVLKQKSKLSWENFLLEERGKIQTTIAYSGDKWYDGDRE